MDLSSNNPPASAAAVKDGEVHESDEAPARIPAVKPLSFSSNGVLKRHNSLHHHHHHLGLNNHHAVVVVYKECLKNHAATLGGHAVDGCGEFMPSPTSNPADPTSLKCAACGCHRNFHRREPDEPHPPPPSAAPALEYQPHHRHHPPPPPPHDHSSPNSPSPPPISSSYYPSAPHMLLALSTGLSGHPTDNNTPISAAAAIPSSTSPSKGRKRFRTKFTQIQKDKMLDFAERIGWKIQKRDEELINDFCREIGVERGVLKVWMHNNKNTVGKRNNSNPTAATVNNENSNAAHSIGFDIGRINCQNLDSAATEFNLRQENNNGNQNHYGLQNNSDDVLGANGSSSSS